MNELDKLIEKSISEHTESESIKRSSLLRIVSIIYQILAFIFIGIGIIGIIAAIGDHKREEESIFAFAILFGGMASLFAGCIGVAIDDIRNRTKTK